MVLEYTAILILVDWGENPWGKENGEGEEGEAMRDEDRARAMEKR